MTRYQFIKVTTDDYIGKVTLNRPKQYNSLNRKMVKEIVEIICSFDNDKDVRVILLSGEGPAFSAGADIYEMAEDTAISLELLNQFTEWDRLAEVKKPIIGAIHGLVLGGGFELALCCDILIAADGTELAFPEVNLGVMPGAGGTQRLTKLVGRAKALEWIWTGERMQVDTALQLGVINQVVAKESLIKEATNFAVMLANKPPLALRLIKESINKAVDSSLYEGMQYERKNFYLLFASEDQKEGMTAFIEKRKPNFKGK